MNGVSQKTREEISMVEEAEEFLRNQKAARDRKTTSIKQVKGSCVEVISKKGGKITKRTITL